MGKEYQEYFWCRLDNAAKIFPAVSSPKKPNVFRLSVTLKETVDKSFLEKATQQTLKEFSSFKVKLHKGFFWYYLETNFNEPIVRKDSPYLCEYIDKWTNNGFLFRVLYFEKKITLEVFHALTDASGAMMFLELLTFYYLKLAHGDVITRQYYQEDDNRSDHALKEDSFLRVAPKNDEKISPSTIPPKAYQIKGVRLSGGKTKVIQGILSTNQVIALAKQHGVTVTVFLLSVLIHTIYQEDFRFNEKNMPILICVPVNLRNMFDSQTARNFFTYVNIGVNPFHKDMTFEEIVEYTRNNLADGLSKNDLANKIKYTVDAEKNFLLRCTPLFVKNMILRYLFAKGERGNTCTLSNIGKVTVPSEIIPYIDHFEFLLSPTKKQMMKTAVCSFEDKMVMSFISSMDETHIQRQFFRRLSKDFGLDVVISCNEEVYEDELL